MAVLLTPETRPKGAPDVIVQSTNSAVVLLNLNSGQYYALDDIGHDVWQLCDGNRTFQDIIGRMAESYDAPLVTLEKDISDLLEELAHEQLITLG